MAQSDTDDDNSQVQQVRCWKLRTSNTVLLASARGAACAVDIALPVVSARFAPGETVPVFWTVRLLTATQTSNALGMRLPPLATSATRTQIAETNVRLCNSRDACGPSTTLSDVAASPLQARNFSATGGSVLFQSPNDLRVDAEGAYVLAAQVRIIDDLDADVSYYYTIFSDINVASATKSPVVLDKQTTYCRRSSQDALAASLSPAQSVAANSSCEIQVVVDSPDVAQPNTTFAVGWKATLTRDASKDIRLPTPLSALDVTGDGKYYEIVSSTVKVCRLGVECDEYSQDNTRDLLASTGATTFTGNFSSGVASFTIAALKLPVVGTYRAFTHLVLAGSDSRRFDVTTYFHVVVTEENAGAQTEQEQFDTGSGAFYCWHNVGLANSSTPLATTSVLAMGKNDECPFSIEMTTLPSTTLSLTESVAVAWKVKQRDSFSTAKFGAGVNLTSVFDSATKAFVNVAQAGVYYCANGTRCNPFSADKQLAFAATATNFLDGEASFASTNLSFPSVGNYTLFVFAVMPSSAAFRLDSAAFATVTVSALATGSLNEGGLSTGTIIGVVAAVIGAVLLVIFGVVFARRYMAKHRRSPGGKEPVFAFRSHTTGTPTRELRSDSRDSNASDDSGTFMYVKAAPSPYGEVRANSLSYDPYARPSFTRLSGDDANYTFTLPADLGTSTTDLPEPPQQQHQQQRL